MFDRALFLLWLMLLCCCSTQATAQDGWRLSYSSGRLRLADRQKTVWSAAMTDVKPYRIISADSPAIVTVCTPELEVATWTAGGRPRCYANMVPVLVQPPLVALSSLPGPEDDETGRIALLDSHGQAIREVERAELLIPATGRLPLDCAYVAISSGGDAITPFGAAPRLAKYSTADGRELWSCELKPELDVGAIELWTAEGAGVLGLQYGYNAYEFMMFSLADGKIQGRKTLAGQPAYRIVYPGPDAEPAGCELQDGILAMLIYPASGEPERWVFDLGEYAIACEPWSGAYPAGAREDNQLAAGGSGPPETAAPPFPQQLLPTQSGASWTIPALVDAEGRVFIVHGKTAEWVDTGQRPPGT